MNTPPGDPQELKALLGALRDGLIDEAQMARLDRMLADDPEARRYYFEYIDLCSTLRHYQGISGRAAGVAAEGGSPPVDAPGRTRREGPRGVRPWSLKTFGALAAAAMLGAVVVLVTRPARRVAAPAPSSAERTAEARRPAGAPTGITEQAPAVDGRRDLMAGDALAVLTRVVGARWDATDQPTEEGATLRPGRLRLAAGWVQVEFFSGASVILEGPADLELISPERAFCRRGKLTTHVPANARGFTVGAPGVDAVDLGTEFALRVDGRGAGELHVLDGAVALHGTGTPPATRDVRTLKTGQGISFGPGDGLREIAAAAAEFVGRARLQQLGDAEHQRRYQRWREYSAALRADPATIVYYSFDVHSPWERALRDVGPRHDEAIDGAVVGCLWTEGRWPGKGALEFKRIGDRVRIDVPGAFESLTLEAWVRIEGLDHTFSSLLLADGYEDQGEIHWQIDSMGRLVLDSLCNSRTETPPILGPADLGRWVHLASVFDAKAKVATHYLDGKRVSRHDVVARFPLRIGAAEIGNWAPGKGMGYPIRSLNGRIDELGIFARALSAEEIRTIYESGKSTP